MLRVPQIREGQQILLCARRRFIRYAIASWDTTERILPIGFTQFFFRHRVRILLSPVLQQRFNLRKCKKHTGHIYMCGSWSLTALMFSAMNRRLTESTKSMGPAMSGSYWVLQGLQVTACKLHSKICRDMHQRPNFLIPICKRHRNGRAKVSIFIAGFYHVFILPSWRMLHTMGTERIWMIRMKEIMAPLGGVFNESKFLFLNMIGDHSRVLVRQILVLSFFYRNVHIFRVSWNLRYLKCCAVESFYNSAKRFIEIRSVTSCFRHRPRTPHKTM